MRKGLHIYSRFFIANLILLFFILPGSFGYAATQGKTWAILVGIDQYDNPDITPLRYAEADARGFASALMKCGGASMENVFVLTSSGKGKMRATRPNLVDWLVRLRKNVKPEDTFIFFFSGHGISMEKRSYILTADAITYPIENLELSALDMVTLRNLLEKIPASKVLIAVDACRNDPRSGKGDADNPMKESFAKNLVIRPGKKETMSVQVAATIYACRVGERSYEWPEKGQGFFSYFLIDGLKGAAKDSKGRVTLLSLLDYLEKKVPEQIRIWKGEASQTPWAEVSGSGAGRWILSFNIDVAPEPSSSDPGISPESQADPMIESGLLARALELFDSKKFAEPPGENSIEVVRKLLKEEPENAAARELEGRAAKAYENQGIMAVEEHDDAKALQIYTRLLELYPEKEEYMRKVLSLRQPPDNLILGDWIFPLSVTANVKFLPDKTCGADWADLFFRMKVSGAWECVDQRNRKYKVSISQMGNFEMILSEDNQSAICNGIRNFPGVTVFRVRKP